MYEYFDHTADLGIRIRAPERNALFAEAATALFAAIVDDLETVRFFDRFDIAIEGADVEYLMFDWLRELLFRFDAEHRLFAKFDVIVDGAGLRATVWGEKIEPSRHVLAHEVKAITYHGLKVARDQDGWIAEVIVDI